MVRPWKQPCGRFRHGRPSAELVGRNKRSEAERIAPNREGRTDLEWRNALALIAPYDGARARTAANSARTCGSVRLRVMKTSRLA